MSILSDTAMWLESHGNLARHPKTRRLMQRMGWTLPFTIGNLHLLWWWALEYAPTGDLTHFEPEQITYDLDLGGATPEQFLEAMIYAGFIDRLGSGSAESRSGGTMIQSGFLDKSEDVVLRIHDWPEYTARSLKPKFRKTPDRWHQVLRSYGLPIPPKRQRRTPALPGFQPPPAEAGEYEPLGAARIDCVKDAARMGEESGSERNQNALRDPRISALCSAENEVQVVSTIDSASTGSENDMAAAPSAPSQPLPGQEFRSAGAEHEQNLVVPPRGDAPIPKSLSGRRNFNDWWVKLQEQYKNKNCPLTAYEQSEVLAMLARNPSTAVEKLQYSVVNFEKSYATLLAPQKKQQRAGYVENST